MSGDPAWLSNLGVTGMMVVVPFVLIVGTSFAKVAVVLHIVRSALGAPGVPPVSVVTALAVVMSFFIMAPVAEDVAQAVERAPQPEVGGSGGQSGVDRARGLYAAAAPPLLDFLNLNTPGGEVDYFQDLAGFQHDPEPGLRIMLPAFASSELVEAFLMGFLILIPFVLIDLIVANVLLSLGMHMMSPTAVSLPLKLLLFVAADGWHLLVSALTASYGL